MVKINSELKNQLPDIYLFNPACEYAVANGNASWQPNRLIKRMEEDLDTLPMFFSNPKDFILVSNMPSNDFIKSLKDVGIKIPNFILLKDALTDKNFHSLPKNNLMPWGWSPAVHKLLSPFKHSCSDDFLSSPVSEWNPNHKNLYSKKYALQLQRELLNEFSSDILLPKPLLAEICHSKKDFEKLISRWGKIMVKAPWSASGRGLQPITKTPVHPKVWEKLLGIVEDQEYAIVEPFLEKVFDLAFQFKSKKGKITFIGASYFNTDLKGQYKGNYLNGLPNNIDNQLKSFIARVNTELVDPLIWILEKSLLNFEYEGFFGIDMLIYLNEKKEFRINPCLEINLRQNMGLLSLKLEQYLTEGKKGIFKTFYKPGETFFGFKTMMEKKYPLCLKQGKIESGFMALTEASIDKQFGAYLLL